MTKDEAPLANLFLLKRKIFLVFTGRRPPGRYIIVREWITGRFIETGSIVLERSEHKTGTVGDE